MITAVLALGEMLPHVRRIAWLARSGSDLLRIRDPVQVVGRRRLDLRPALMVMTVQTLQVLAVPVPVLGRGWARLDPAHWPTGLLSELRDIEQNRPVGTPIFNEMLFGGFLIDFTPHLRVFIDDRCELYDDRMLLDYTHAVLDEPARIEQWARHYGFNLVLTQPGSGFDHYLSRAPGWRLVRRAAAASLFRRHVEHQNR